MPLKPYKKYAFCCFSACFALLASYGQGKSGAIHSIKPTTDFDQRFYYTPGDVQNVWGYRLGVLINDKYKLGIGGYYMNETDAVGQPVTPMTRTTMTAATLHKQLYLGTVYYEPYLLRRTFWESSLVFETGYGRTVNYSVDKTDYSTFGKINGVIVPVGAGLSVNLKLPALFDIKCFRWIGVNAMAGYLGAVYSTQASQTAK